MILRKQLNCAEQPLNNARIGPASESDHIPLNLACRHGSPLPIVKMLLERRAQLLPRKEGIYPQHMMARVSLSSHSLFALWHCFC
ncbi:hypothetical protein BDW59DRAFT_14207 [Aspergillus cavernicola]|uniref:Ankyrin repeat-containing domain protein n=1 Tax=Aspergillus cavernicola TaxID=176166 RepID=A0ABR4IT85_9EURO